MWGPIIGVSVFQAISLWIGPFSPYNQLFLGVAVLVTAVLFKGGIIEGAGRVADRVRSLRSDAPEVEVERSEEHTSELQSLMRTSYAVFCLKKKNNITQKSTQK